ncbi:ferritin-like domain-containing protein [Hymenobacter sp. ASUV-10]|uniref:Ferritin-like domain-containing protein n=1 Tax=Hymenobacter aranciens TaxID=3063996 RepID=A0ABT9B8R6_9BACT|nr:ferritin-like domain-containing protein [Hymenobacter sp. ASUV-10]MDO7874640.1 ferritin-like domain-containing protein [Hymenobacter sp. ASUV-10]
MSSSSLSDTSTGTLVRRRTFLQAAGVVAGATALTLAGCSDDTPTTPVDPYLLSLQEADAGLLNYLYLLEQLEAGFYQQVLDVPPTDLQASDLTYLRDLRDHELIHRETLLFALGSANAAPVPTLTFNFSTLNLTTRAGVLAAAKTFEELGVAAYNGVLHLVADTTTLQLLAKIASVEARHADFINELLTPNTFATTMVVNEGPLFSVAASKTPTQVIAEAAPFFLPYKVSVTALPTT